jgi:hypothetical protein
MLFSAGQTLRPANARLSKEFLNRIARYRRPKLSKNGCTLSVLSVRAVSACQEFSSKVFISAIRRFSQMKNLRSAFYGTGRWRGI